MLTDFEVKIFVLFCLHYKTTNMLELFVVHKD